MKKSKTPVQFLLKKDLLSKVNFLSFSTISRLEQKSEFPRRRKLSSKRVGWVLSEVEKWLERKAKE